LAPQFDDECCLRDIIEITVTLYEPQKSRYIHELELLGCVSRAEADEVVLEGPNFRMVVTDATTERDGVLEIKMRLSEQKSGQQVYQFGPHTEVVFDESRTATWTF
jgi:hypothetical protein